MSEFRNGSFTLKDAYVYDTKMHRFVTASLRVSDGVIASIGNFAASESGEGIDLGGMFVIPGMIDVHTHGRAGFDFPYLSADELEIVRQSYARAGTTTIMATIGSCPVDSTRRLISLLREAPRDNGSANIGGLHFEGRYINYVRRGAHNPDLLAPPDAAEIAELLDLLMCGTKLRAHVTAAPELEGGMEFIDAVLEKGATFGIGHSDATYDEAMKAVERGAKSFSHLFNAMSPLHHREPGCVGAGMLSDAYVELICDGFHLNPAAVRMVQRMKDSDRIVLITDSCMAAGMGDGVYYKNGTPVYVKNGHVTKEDGVISGSTLNLYDGLNNFAEFCGLTLEEAIPAATINPAKMVGLDGVCGSIEEGKRADLLIIDAKRRLKAVCVGGKWMKTDE